MSIISVSISDFYFIQETSERFQFSGIKGFGVIVATGHSLLDGFTALNQ